jgi:hypothetical protein
MTSIQRMVPLKQVLDDLCREELNLKRVGAFAQAAGIRDAIVRILRIADGPPPSIDPSE